MPLRIYVDDIHSLDEHSAGMDAFINKGETPERVAEKFRTVAASIPVNGRRLGEGGSRNNPPAQTKRKYKEL